MGDLLYVDFQGSTSADAELARLAAHFMQWITPTLDAAHIQRQRPGIGGGFTAMDLASLREDVRDAMTGLYLQHHDVAGVTLRRALLQQSIRRCR